MEDGGWQEAQEGLGAFMAAPLLLPDDAAISPTNVHVNSPGALV